MVVGCCEGDVRQVRGLATAEKECVLSFELVHETTLLQSGGDIGLV